MKTFASLKKESSGKFDDLVKKLETAAGNSQQSFADDRFWTPTKDKSGKAYAIIRFLPSGPLDEIPFVKFYSHGFKGPRGKWFIEDCPTTIGKTCPVCEANNELWNSGDDEKKKIVSGQGKDKPGRKRKLIYIFNILVVSDPANKETEGKNFLFKGGKKIMDKIMAKMKPEFESERAINVFNFDDGANFKLMIKNVEGYPNYDGCEFSEVSNLFEGDEKKQEALWKQLYTLGEFTAESKFKSYNDLKTKFDTVWGGYVSIPTTANEADSGQQKDVASSPSLPASEPDEDDETMKMFQQMAEEA